MPLQKTFTDGQPPHGMNISALKSTKFMLNQIRPYRGAFACGLLFVLVSALLGLLLPRGIARIFSMISQSGTTAVPSPTLIGGFVLFLLAFFLCRFVAQYLFVRIRHRMSQSLALDLYDRFAAMPRFRRIHRSIESYQHTFFDDVANLVQYMTMVLPRTLIRMGLMMGSLLAIFQLSWKLSLGIGALVLGTILLFSGFRNAVKKLLVAGEKERVAYKAQVNAIFKHIDTLNAMNCREFGRKLLREKEGSWQKLARQCLLVQEAWSTGLMAVLSFYFLGFAFGLCVMIQYKICDVAWASQYFTYLGMLLINTLNSSSSVQSFLSILKSMDRIRDFATKDADNVKEVRAQALAVAPGEWVAVIGRSGVGKTTAIRAFLGLDHMQSGPVCGYLDQDTPIFPVSLVDNIDLGRGYSMSRIREALDAACMDPALVQTYLADDRILNDKILSGGEKLRIGLARAILGQPEVLVLDEPSAALDSKTEAQLLEKLRAFLNPQVKLIAVTHSKAFLQAMDRVIELHSPQPE